MPPKRSPEDARVAMQLGAAIRAARHGRTPKMTIEALAARANLSSDFVARMEEGRHQPSVGVLLRLCRALDLEVVDVLAAAGLAKETAVNPAVGRMLSALSGRPAEAVALAADLVDAVGRAFPKLSARQPRKRPSPPSR